MPDKKSGLSSTVWIGGLLIASAIVAAGIAVYFYSHVAK